MNARSSTTWPERRETRSTRSPNYKARGIGSLTRPGCGGARAADAHPLRHAGEYEPTNVRPRRDRNDHRACAARARAASPRKLRVRGNTDPLHRAKVESEGRLRAPVILSSHGL